MFIKPYVWNMYNNEIIDTGILRTDIWLQQTQKNESHAVESSQKYLCTLTRS